MLTIFSALLATCCTLHAIGYEVVDAVQMLSSTMQYNTDQYNSSSTMDVGQSVSTENMNPELSSNSNISAASSYSSQSSQSMVLIGCTTAAFSVVAVVFFVIVLVGYFRVRRSRDVSIVGHRKTLPTVNELDPIDRSSSSSYSRHTPTAPSSHRAGASEVHDVEGQKSTEDGARSEPIQMQTNSGTSEAETQVVRRARRSTSDRKVLETWILPMHRRSFQLGKKRPQSAEDEHDYVNVFERETADDVAHDYVNVDAAAKKSGGSTSYENCEVVKDPRRTSQDPKWGGNKTTHLSILDPSVKALAKSVPAINLIYVRETAGVDSCSDDDSSLDSNYVDMASKQMKEKLQRPKLGVSLSSSAPEMASTKQIAIYENERIPSTKTRPISTKQNKTKFHGARQGQFPLGKI